MFAVEFGFPFAFPFPFPLSTPAFAFVESPSSGVVVVASSLSGFIGGLVSFFLTWILTVSPFLILFVTEKEIEQVEGIERFIDREYYEVAPQFVIENPANVISEITMDIN